MSDFKAMILGEARPDAMQTRDLVGYGASPPDPRWPARASDHLRRWKPLVLAR
jgi:hypothetical protein